MHGELIVLRRREPAMVGFGIALRRGTGSLQIDQAVLAAQEWRQAAQDAWAAAKQLSQRHDYDAHLSVDTENALSGMSAGVIIGVTALAALLDVRLPPTHATGRVLWPGGFLVGGRATAAKAGFLAGRSRGSGPAIFLSPPLHRPVTLAGVTVSEALDLASAFALAAPHGPAMPALQHRRSCTAIAAQVPGDVERPFVACFADRDDPETLVQGVRVLRVRTAGQAFAVYGEGGRAFWAGPVDDPSDAGLAGTWHAVRRCVADAGALPHD